MDKVYQGCMLVDEKELELMCQSIGMHLKTFLVGTEGFNELAKLYTKLLKEKEDIQRERAKFEPKTEGV